MKKYLITIVGVFALLASLQSLITFKRVSDDYRAKLSLGYALIVVSERVLSKEEFVEAREEVKSVEKVAVEEVIEDIDNELSAENILQLREDMPNFYRVKLNSLPDKFELFSIEERFAEIPGVIKVEGFSAVQNRLSALFEVIGYILGTFTALFFLSAVIHTYRETKLWHYEHFERLHIISLLGGKVFERSKSLYIFALISSTLATLITVSLSLFLAYGSMADVMVKIGLEPLKYNIFLDTVVLLLVSFAVTLLPLTYVVYRTEQER